MSEQSRVRRSSVGTSTTVLRGLMDISNSDPDPRWKWQRALQSKPYGGPARDGPTSTPYMILMVRNADPKKQQAVHSISFREIFLRPAPATTILGG